MRKFEVNFLPQAAADLSSLYDYITEIAGRGVAAGYLGRIQAACKNLENFPHRGTARDDIRPGLRTMGFERRATIVFQVKDEEVVIARIFYGGQDYERQFRRLDDPDTDLEDKA